MFNDTLYRSFLIKHCVEPPDSAHDMAHTLRVVSNSKSILKEEPADAEIVLAAAWLHDCVVLPKNHPKRKKASGMAAEKAVRFLSEAGFPPGKLDGVAHAIESHSFSAGIPPETIEAKIVQDADRLDAVGAIGIARCFIVAGQLSSPIYNPDDPFCVKRDPDDAAWTIDHFFKKLFKLPETMNTKSAKKEAVRRAGFMRQYLNELGREIG